MSVVGFPRVYEAYMRALHSETPKHVSDEEVRNIFDAAYQVHQDVAAGRALSGDLFNTENQLRSIYNATRADRLTESDLTIDPVGAQRLWALLQTQRMAHPDTPDQSFLKNIPAALKEFKPFDASLGLGKGLASYSGELVGVEVPPFLRGDPPPVLGMLHDFGAGGSQRGSGVHLGGGYVLTARHVSDQDLPHGSPRTPFVGRRDYSQLQPGMTLRVAPDKGALGQVIPKQLDPAGFGRENDWALLQSPHLVGQPAVPAIRRTSSLSPGERVYIVGDRTGASFRVASGVMGGIVGNNASVNRAAVEGGFSGSPAFDSRGDLVGVVYARAGATAHLVTTDAILAVLDEARKQDPTLPQPLVREGQGAQVA